MRESCWSAECDICECYIGPFQGIEAYLPTKMSFCDTCAEKAGNKMLGLIKQALTEFNPKNYPESKL